jgi:outer membrane usher protein
MYIQFKNKEVYFRLALITCMIKASLFSHSAFAEEYRFDNNLLAGSGFAKGISLEKFNDTEVIIAPGQQNLDLVLNGTKIKARSRLNSRRSIRPTKARCALTLS